MLWLINSNLELDFTIEIIKVEIWLTVGISVSLDLVNSPFMCFQNRILNGLGFFRSWLNMLPLMCWVIVL